MVLSWGFLVWFFCDGGGFVLGKGGLGLLLPFFFFFLISHFILWHPVFYKPIQIFTTTFLLPVRMQFILHYIVDISLNFVVTWNLTFHSGGRRYFGFIWSPPGIYNFLDFTWNLYPYRDTKKGPH